MSLLKQEKNNEYAIENTEYTEAGLQKIEEVSLLSGDNLKKIKDIAPALVESWQKERIWRTEVEMSFSVLNDTKFPTLGLKYQQARREQEVHFRNLMYLATEYEEKQGELIELEGDIEVLEQNTELNEKVKKGKLIQLGAKVKRCEWQLTEMQKAGHHRVREVTTWEKLKKQMEEENASLPNPENLDDYDTVQANGYGIRWQKELENELKSPNAKGNRIGVLEGSLSALKRRK